MRRGGWRCAALRRGLHLTPVPPTRPSTSQEVIVSLITIVSFTFLLAGGLASSAARTRR
jgi:hypothetical protein